MKVSNVVVGTASHGPGRNRSAFPSFSSWEFTLARHAFRGAENANGDRYDGEGNENYVAASCWEHSVGVYRYGRRWRRAASSPTLQLARKPIGLAFAHRPDCGGSMRLGPDLRRASQSGCHRSASSLPAGCRPRSHPPIGSEIIGRHPGLAGVVDPPYRFRARPAAPHRLRPPMAGTLATMGDDPFGFLWAD